MTSDLPITLCEPWRLQEIYELRTFAWENSPGAADINSKRFPNGYSDILDSRSIHFKASTHEGKIVAAARLTLCESIRELPYQSMFKWSLDKIPSTSPFLFYSRLVIHPAYRKRGLRQQFDEIRLRKQMDMDVSFGLVTINRKRQVQLAQYGFKFLADAFASDEESPFTGLGVMMIDLSDIRIPQPA